MEGIEIHELLMAIGVIIKKNFIQVICADNKEKFE
jgi:hypothetical protein